MTDEGYWSSAPVALRRTVVRPEINGVTVHLGAHETDMFAWDWRKVDHVIHGYLLRQAVMVYPQQFADSISGQRMNTAVLLR
jgi:hypothetical protein